MKWIAEVQGYTQFANSIQLTTLFTYMTPLFLGQWALQNISTKILQDFEGSSSKNINVNWTPVREWILFEENLLIAQVYFGIIFVLIGYFFKFHGIWNMAGIDDAERIRRKKYTIYWKQRSQQDYLSYMKFEFMQFSFFGAYLFNTVFVYPTMKQQPSI